MNLAKRWRRTASTAAGLTATITLVLVPSLANASDEPRGAKAQTSQVGLALVAFDAEVAAANGYEIRTTESGRLYSVPAGTKANYKPKDSETAPAPVDPDEVSTQALDIRYGQCGWSSVAVNNTSWSTAYNVSNSVWYSKWGVKIVSNWGVSDYNLDHGATGNAWNTGGTPPAAHTGYGYAEVNAGSYVVMSNGGYCESLQPHAAFVFS